MSPMEEELEREHIDCHREVNSALHVLQSQMQHQRQGLESLADKLDDIRKSLSTRESQIAVLEIKVEDLRWLKTAFLGMVLSSISQLLFLVFTTVLKK